MRKWKQIVIVAAAAMLFWGCGACAMVVGVEQHHYGGWTVTKEATCTEPGERRHTCTDSGCGKVEYEEIPAKGHSWAEWEIVTEATCGTEGSRKHVCSECGEEETEAIAATGEHSYGEWTVTEEATCTEEGSRQRECSVCHKEETETIAATGHVYGEWTVTEEATCTEEGSRRRECSMCHKEEMETIAATGHTYSEEWTGDGTYHWHASTCGHTEETKDKAEHIWDEGTVSHESACAENGEMLYTCTVCGAERTEIIPATGHTASEDWDFDSAAHWHKCLLCGEQIDREEHQFGTDKICTVCGQEERYTEGLEFTLSDSEDQYSVTGIGTATDTDIVIPSVYNGLPVTSIGYNAFYKCSGLTSVEIPDSVTSIG